MYLALSSLVRLNRVFRAVFYRQLRGGVHSYIDSYKKLSRFVPTGLYRAESCYSVSKSFSRLVCTRIPAGIQTANIGGLRYTPYLVSSFNLMCPHVSVSIGKRLPSCCHFSSHTAVGLRLFSTHDCNCKPTSVQQQSRSCVMATAVVARRDLLLATGLSSLGCCLPIGEEG